MPKSLSFFMICVTSITALSAQEFSREEMQRRVDSIAQIRKEQNFQKAISRIEQYQINTQKDTFEVLDLSEARLSKVPDFAREFKNVKNVRLSGNSIKKLPRYFQEFDSLEVLSWSRSSNKKFRAPTMKQVKILHLSQNGMTKFPKVVRKFKNIEILSVESNNLITVSKSVKRLNQLKELKLDRNHNLKIDQELLKRLPENLKVLKFNNCSLTTIPYEIYSLKIEELQLRENKINTIPDGISKMTNLRKLSLYKNQLEKLPGDFFQLNKLKSLDLYHNKLKSISSEISTFDSLQILYLAHNELYTVPLEIGTMEQLRELYLHHNHLSEIPLTYGGLKNLRTFRVNDNVLSHFPEAVHGMASIQFLDVSANLIETLPRTLLQLTNLSLFAFNDNEIDFYVPENQSILPMIESMMANGVRCIPSVSREELGQ